MAITKSEKQLVSKMYKGAKKSMSFPKVSPKSKKGIAGVKVGGKLYKPKKGGFGSLLSKPIGKLTPGKSVKRGLVAGLF